MDILFATPQLRDVANDTRLLQRKYSADAARKIRRRLDDLLAATCLQDLYRGPGRLHELVGNRRGQLAMEITGGLRLIFEPANVPLPLKTDGGLDWSMVTQIRILELEDYH